MALLLVIGDRHDRGGIQPSVELWRAEFLGWDVMHRFLADSPCTPRRYVLLELGRVIADGSTDSPYLLPGDLFRITVRDPAEGLGSRAT